MPNLDGHFASESWSRLCQEFWQNVAAGNEVLTDHPVLRYCESFSGARAVAGWAEGGEVASTVAARAARSIKDRASLMAWVHLAVAMGASLPTDPAPDVVATLLALCRGTMPADDRAGNRAEHVRRVTNTLQAMTWREPAATAIFLHALRGAASIYRRGATPKERQHVAPWLVALLRIVFRDYRHFWSALRTGSFQAPSDEGRPDPLQDIACELTAIDELKRRGREERQQLRTLAQLALRDPAEYGGKLRELLDNLLHGLAPESATCSPPKPSPLAQHTFFVVSSSQDLQNSDLMPYKEVLEALLGQGQVVPESEGSTWKREPVPHSFQKIIASMLGGGWKRAAVEALLATHYQRTGSGSLNVDGSGKTLEAVWISDGEFSLLFSLAFGCDKLPASLRAKDLVPELAETDDAIVLQLGKNLYTDHLCLFKDDERFAARGYALFNFVEWQLINNCLEFPSARSGDVCSEALRRLLRATHEALIGSDPAKALEKALRRHDDFKGVSKARALSRLQSLFLEALLRDKRPQPTSLFFLPLLHWRDPQGHYLPLAIYAGTFIGLESDDWPYVRARNECHLQAVRDLMQPVFDVFTARALEDYKRSFEISRPVFNSTVELLTSELDAIDEGDRAFGETLRNLPSALLLDKIHLYTGLREKRLRDLTVRIAGALDLLNAGGAGEWRNERLRARYEQLVRSRIVAGMLDSAKIHSALDLYLGQAAAGDPQAIERLSEMPIGGDTTFGDFFAPYVAAFRATDSDAGRRHWAKSLFAITEALSAWLSRFLFSTNPEGHRIAYMFHKKERAEELEAKWNTLPEAVRTAPALQYTAQILESLSTRYDEFQRHWQAMRLNANELERRLGGVFLPDHLDNLESEHLHTDKSATVFKFEGALSSGLILALPALPALPNNTAELKNILVFLIEDRIFSGPRHGFAVRCGFKWLGESRELQVLASHTWTQQGLRGLSRALAETVNLVSYPTKTAVLWSLARGWVEIQVAYNGKLFDPFRSMASIDEHAPIHDGVVFRVGAQEFKA